MVKGHTSETLDKPGTVVVNLADSLLDEGRLIIAENIYINVPLAEYLMTKKLIYVLLIEVKEKNIEKKTVYYKTKRVNYNFKMARLKICYDVIHLS